VDVGEGGGLRAKSPTTPSRNSRLRPRSNTTEFGGAGVRVNGVASGPVRSPGTVSLLAAHADAMDQVTARGRIGDPEEIAEVVLFLVEERSSYVNGTVVAVHGGERSLLPG
jgi:NAD(P)-dependent dehydrogenase (short-subunit alcohol dehydrogenase family)